VITIFSKHGTGELTGLEILVLKIIKKNAGITGYDIIQKISSKPRGLWKGTAGSIYPILEKLAKKGLVRIEELDDTKRVKKGYHITTEGIEVLKKTLKNKIYPSMHSFMDSIFTLIGDLPSVKRNVETMFCSFPHHRNIEIDETDLSLENLEHIKNLIKRLETSRIELNQRIKFIDNKIAKYKIILANIQKERKEKSKPIEIYGDEMYS
jgi:DNA-binding PadR family transcriptional regulator